MRNIRYDNAVVKGVSLAAQLPRARRMGPTKCHSPRHTLNLREERFRGEMRLQLATAPASENCLKDGVDHPPKAAAARL